MSGRYDFPTVDRLVQCYGHDRAVSIVNGRDEATNADLASWRRLGGFTTVAESRRDRRPDPSLPLEDRVMFYAARDIKPTVIASYFHVPASRVIAIIEAHA